MFINGQTKLEEIQVAFSEAFPYLKIEFFDKEHGYMEKVTQQPITETWRRVEEFTSNRHSGILYFDENLAVNTFEQYMKRLYGLNVQVYRRSKGEWLETWATDSWTLKEQNNRAKSISKKSA